MNHKSSGIVHGTIRCWCDLFISYSGPEVALLSLRSSISTSAEAHSRIDCLLVGLQASRFTDIACTPATRHALEQTRVQQRRLRSPLRSAPTRRMKHANFRKLFIFWKRMHVNDLGIFYPIHDCTVATKCPESSKHKIML